MDIITKVHAIRNTLEILDMPSTFNNVNRMLGIYNALDEILNELMKRQKEQEANENAGEDHPE